MRLKHFTLLSCFVLLPFYGLTQEYAISCIGFYNVENLFDTLDTEQVNDLEFTPQGKNQWGTARYQHKLHNIARVIAEIGTNITPDGAAILGVSEIENKAVLEDLVQEASIADRDYQIIHYDSPDRRGIDVALLYQANYFEPTSTQNFELYMPSDTSLRTRSQLLVSGNLLGERVHLMVAHWPSRSGGEKGSRPKRIAAAQLGRSIIDSIQAVEPNAKIIYMGDLNDDPTNKSLSKHLGSVGSKKQLKKASMYNPMWEMYQKGIGSLAWRDTWNIFDQLLLSTPFLNNNSKGLQFYQAKVFNEPFLMQSDGVYKGYPLRTFAGGNYKGGFSDHFPVYLYLLKKQ